MRFYVSQDDIEKGEKASKCNCPVARAVRRALPQCRIAVPFQREIRINDHNYKPSTKVEQFVRRFDKGKPVSPFSFYLKINQ